MIGIIGAMDIEVEDLKERMREADEERIGGILFISGLLGKKKCVTAVCGPGKVNAAVCAQIMISRYNPDLLINTGVAGGIGTGIKIGDFAIATDVVQHDIDTTGLGDPKGLIPGIHVIKIPCSERVIDKIFALEDKFPGIRFHKGIIATGDQFINQNEKFESIKEEFDAIACEMEAGSIGQVCFMNRVEFIAIRSISDHADDNSHVDYPIFVKKTAQISIQLVMKLIQTL